jgi:hypothetical protein
MLNGLKIASQEEGIDGVRESGGKTLVLFGWEGMDGHASLSPEDLDGIAVLDPHANESNRVYSFTDEQSIPWKVSLVDYGVYRFESQGLEGLRGDISADQLFPPSDSLASPDVAKLRDAGIRSGVISPAESGSHHFDAAKKTAWGPDIDAPGETLESMIAQAGNILQDSSMTVEDRLIRAHAEIGAFLENEGLMPLGGVGGDDPKGIYRELEQEGQQDRELHEQASVKTATSGYAHKTELTTPDGYEIDSYNPYADPSKARRFTVWPPQGNAVGDYTTLEEAIKAIEQWKQRGDPKLLTYDGGANFKIATEAPVPLFGSFTAVVRQEGSTYIAKCPQVGTESRGTTSEESVANLKKATLTFLEESGTPGSTYRG